MNGIERETIILFNEVESECEVYTYNHKIKNKLDKKCENQPDLYHKISDDSKGGITYRFPKKLLTIAFREPIPQERKANRDMAKQIENLKKWREKQKERKTQNV